jgi:hypothetical protein
MHEHIFDVNAVRAVRVSVTLEFLRPRSPLLAEAVSKLVQMDPN